MPYTGDHIKKEKEALDLMIKMRKGAQDGNRQGGLVFFVVLPLLLAVGLLKSKEIKDWAAHNHQVSQLIRLAYPDWQEATPVALPAQFDATQRPEQSNVDASGQTGSNGQVAPAATSVPGDTAPAPAGADGGQPVAPAPAEGTSAPANTGQ